MCKIFVLDTNVLLHDPTSLESFADNTIVLPMAVIEELDKFKTHNNELGRNSRLVIRRIDELRTRGRLKEGVPMDNGGVLRIVTAQTLPTDPGLEQSLPDNRIIRVAYHFHSSGENVIFVTKDINARLKADALGIQAVDFEKRKINFDELFTGCRDIKVPRKLVDDFYKTEMLEVAGHDFYPNEFVMMADETNEKHTALARALDETNLVHLNAKFEKAWNLKPRSKEQRLALELLMDPSVQLVTLVGQAGTGKTLLALAAGLEMTVHYNRYAKILVSRPIMPLGKDIGYLPGAKDAKLSHWMGPIFDNLSFLMRDGAEGGGQAVREKIDALINKDVIELEALTYIRGRSIPKQYVIVDEAQNLTPHEVKTIISRAGDQTKMVLTGDPYQIDNPYLDSASNGLTYTVERLKSQAVHGHITLRKSERSGLAAVAADLL